MDDGDVKPKATLEELAGERFPDLSEAELKLLRAAPEGSLAHCGDPKKSNEDPLFAVAISGLVRRDRRVILLSVGPGFCA